MLRRSGIDARRKHRRTPRRPCRHRAISRAVCGTEGFRPGNEMTTHSLRGAAWKPHFFADAWSLRRRPSWALLPRPVPILRGHMPDDSAGELSAAAWRPRTLHAGTDAARSNRARPARPAIWAPCMRCRGGGGASCCDGIFGDGHRFTPPRRGLLPRMLVPWSAGLGGGTKVRQSQSRL